MSSLIWPAARVTSPDCDDTAQSSAHASTATDRRPRVIEATRSAKLVSSPKPPDGAANVSALCAGCSSSALRAISFVAPLGRLSTATTTYSPPLEQAIAQQTTLTHAARIERPAA